MKKIFIASCIAVFAMSAQAVAQNGTTTATEQVSVQDEIRATSGELKEAYGILSQDLAHLNREIGPNADAATPAQAATRDAMKTTLSQLEGMLSTVNTANEEQWADIKAKAATVRAKALDLVAARKAAK
jgi:hypothetical protein